MRKPFALLVLLYTMLLIFGCNKGEISGNSPCFSFDKDGHYIGFTDLTSDYTFEDARTDGYFAAQDIENVVNKGAWDSFVATSARKENSSIRFIKFSTSRDDSPYYSDLFYNEGYYYAFDSTAENQEKTAYKYLLHLKGQFGNPIKDTGVVILTDDDTLTFEQVMQSGLSSDLFYKRSISPYKLIMFTIS